jgi:putative hydrolases of HD superfamily
MNISDVRPPLRFVAGTDAIWAKLDELPRTGWVQWGIPEPETVAEHVMATRNLAVEWKAELGLSATELAEVLAIIEVHDWPKVHAGDQVILGDELDVDELKKQKRLVEEAAMSQLCAGLENGEEIMTLYKVYERQVDGLARLAKELGMFQALYIARTYESSHHKLGLLAEFIHYTEPYLSHPFLINKLKELKAGV